MTGSFMGVLVKRFEALEADLNGLDAATGDGDHGTTILRGLKAAATSNGPAAKAFRMAAGGASGSLFGFLIGALETTEEKTTPLGEALSKAARQISEVGQARAGDKTMLDALIPAAEAALADPEDAAAAAARAAQSGLAATKAMTAKRGRARYVENGGVGHLDAGAMSVAQILAAFETDASGAS
jgi:phosphoenolpyruvate---glycerone phosphotransferase subunit DhaL